MTQILDNHQDHDSGRDSCHAEGSRDTSCSASITAVTWRGHVSQAVTPVLLLSRRFENEMTQVCHVNLTQHGKTSPGPDTVRIDRLIALS